MIYIAGYFMVGAVLGVVVSRWFRQGDSGLVMFFLWPLMLVIFVPWTFFYWVADLGRKESDDN